jgi:hypothetical protein
VVDGALISADNGDAFGADSNGGKFVERLLGFAQRVDGTSRPVSRSL